MDKYQSVRIAFVSKPTISRRQLKVAPFRYQRQDKHVNSQLSSSNSIPPCTPTTATIKTQSSKTFFSNSLPSFNNVEQSVKYTSKDIRKKNQEKKKKIPKKWIIIIVIVLILIILAVGLYLIIHFTTQTNTTKSPMTNPVLRWNATGRTIAGITGSPGINASQLSFPVDLALDSSNTLYIVEYTNSRVQKWLPGAKSGTTVAGQANGTSGNTAAYLNNPCGLYIDLNDNIYVADTLNNRVQLWTNGASNGILVAGTGSSGSLNNQLYNPYGIQQDPNAKTLYIADYQNNRVMSYTSGASTGSVVAGGNGSGTATTQLINPVGIYLDLLTNSIIIANFGASNIVRWVLGANSWTLIAGNITGSSGSSSTTLNICTGVTLDPMGNIYVADTGNHRIQFFSAGQTEGTTLAGISTVSGNNSTQLYAPYAVRLDSQLNLYVVDTGNNRIQLFQRH